MPRCALFRVAPLLVLIAGPPKKAGPSTVSNVDRRALHAGAPLGRCRSRGRHAVRKPRQSRRRQGPARAPAETLPNSGRLSLRRAGAQNEKSTRGRLGFLRAPLACAKLASRGDKLRRSSSLRFDPNSRRCLSARAGYSVAAKTRGHPRLTMSGLRPAIHRNS